MRTSFDFETTLIRPGLQAPPVVCCSFADEADRSGLVGTYDVERYLAAFLESGVEGHNVAYDLGCAWEWFPALRPAIVRAYDDLRVTDTRVRERCLEIVGDSARKELSLGTLARRYGYPHALDKEGSTRTDYGRFWGAPVESYTEEHRTYALHDALATRYVGKRQRERAERVGVTEEDVARLTRKQFWLQVMRNRGLRTDPTRIDELRAAVLAQLGRLEAFAIDLGLMRRNKDGSASKNMAEIRAAVTEAYDGRPPLTEKGGVKTDALTLEEAESPDLETFAELGEWRALWNLVKEGEYTLVAGTTFPLHTKFGIADTTRTTSSKPNVQNFRRDPPKGPKIRECIVPRPGKVFLHADHTGLENATLAQHCVNAYGLRRLADFLNAGGDLHCATGGEIRGQPYADFVAAYGSGDQAASDARQFAKIPNFGRAGGIGAKKLGLFARKQAYAGDTVNHDLIKPVEFWQSTIKAWERANPDGAHHLVATARSGYGPRDDQRFDVQIPGTRLVRRRIRYAAACNTPFQGLATVVEGEVGWILFKAMWTGSGALATCRGVNFIHDEFALEAPDDQETVTAAALELRETMTTATRDLLPDLDMRSEVTAMRRWSKSAKSKFVDGRLTIWG